MGGERKGSRPLVERDVAGRGGLGGETIHAVEQSVADLDPEQPEQSRCARLCIEQINMHSVVARPVPIDVRYT